MSRTNLSNICEDRFRVEYLFSIKCKLHVLKINFKRKIKRLKRNLCSIISSGSKFLLSSTNNRANQSANRTNLVYSSDSNNLNAASREFRQLKHGNINGYHGPVNKYMKSYHKNRIYKSYLRKNKFPRLDERICVVCYTNEANVKTLPCAHCEICSDCLIETILVALKTRQFPLKCVICRQRVEKITNPHEYEMQSTQKVTEVLQRAKTISFM